MKNRFHTDTVVRTGIRIMASLVFGAAVLFNASCVKEDTGDCPVRTLLYIVVDTEGWDAVDVVNGATMFLFDGDRKLLSSREVSGADIAAGKPIEISYTADETPWVAVWGNLGDRENIPAYPTGKAADEMFISMARDADGNALDSDMLFYGAKQLTGADVEHVTITPKTGRITVTVRGLPTADPDAFFVTVETPYDTYDYTGAPIAGNASLRFPLIPGGTDMVTPKPYHLFHFPDPAAADDHLTVRLYDNRSAGAGFSPVVLTETQYDDNGEPIVIRRGKTTNVLIYIVMTGNIEVTVRITDWHSTYGQSNGW